VSPSTVGFMLVQRLQAGDELRCPHCGSWHRLTEKATEGTSTGAGMLYFHCRGLTYFGGFVEAASRHETRKANKER
jgi:hypothetical protein